MTEGNTLLNDEELEMLTVLRINKDFIMKYRKIYREQLNEQFQHTVVRDSVVGAQPHRAGDGQGAQGDDRRGLLAG